MNGPWIRRLWQRRGVMGIILWTLLLPLSALYWLAVTLRNASYSFGWKKVRRLDPFVISIGNLTVGGTGKTPTVIWMAQELGKLGFKVAILSRGYGRKGNQPQRVTANLSDGTDEFGDEPAMMARIFGLTVAVAGKRYQAAEEILQARDVDVFLLDDGFQHRELNRDMDLVVLGSDVAGWMLPGGPFREPKSALRRADCLLITGARESWQDLVGENRGQPVFYGSLQPQALIALQADHWQELSLSRLAGRKILAVTGIAHPEPFYRMIELSRGEIVRRVAFPDHHDYSDRDGQNIAEAARDADVIVTTEKDILKLVRFPFTGKELLALRVGMIVEGGAALLQSIVARIQKKQSTDLVFS